MATLRRIGRQLVRRPDTRKLVTSCGAEPEPPAGPCPEDCADCVPVFTVSHTGFIVERINIFPNQTVRYDFVFPFTLCQLWNTQIIRCPGTFCADCGGPSTGCTTDNPAFAWEYRFNLTPCTGTGGTFTSWVIETNASVRFAANQCPTNVAGVEVQWFSATEATCPTVPYSILSIGGGFGVEVISPGVLTIA